MNALRALILWLMASAFICGCQNAPRVMDDPQEQLIPGGVYTAIHKNFSPQMWEFLKQTRIHESDPITFMGFTIEAHGFCNPFWQEIRFKNRNSVQESSIVHEFLHVIWFHYLTPKQKDRFRDALKRMRKSQDPSHQLMLTLCDKNYAGYQKSYGKIICHFIHDTEYFAWIGEKLVSAEDGKIIPSPSVPSYMGKCYANILSLMDTEKIITQHKQQPRFLRK